MALVASAVVFTPQPAQAAGLLPVTPTSIDFGAVAVGQMSPWIAVTYDAAYRLTSTNNGEGIQLDHTPALNCNTPTCSLLVRFAPTSVGAFSDTVGVVAWRAGDSFEVSVPWTGQGVPPAAGASVSPSATDFSDVVVGQSGSKTLTFSNTGSVPVDLTAITVSAPFARTGGTCATSVAVGADCTIIVGFTPTAPGPASATLTVSTAQTGDHLVALSGTGVAPREDISLTPSSVVFPATEVGATSAEIDVTVTNTGNVPVTFSSYGVSGQFTFAGISCSWSLKPGSSCTVRVKFMPTVRGAATSPVYVALASGLIRRADVSGIGVAPDLVPTPGSVDFGEVEVGAIAAPMPVTISNEGSSAAPVSATVTGPFQVDASACSSSLAPGADCDALVTFAPTAGGAATGAVTFTAGSSTAPVTLTGTGQPLRVDVTSLDLGSVPVGSSATATATVTNLSAADAPVTIAEPAAPFSLADDCPAVLPANGTCTLTVTYAPTAVGASSSNVVVSNPSAGNLTVALTGSAIEAVFDLGVTPTSSSFASIEVGATSPALPFVVKNKGNSPVALGTVSATGDFAVASTTCTGTLAVDATCEIGVTFAPSKAGDRTGTLSIVSNADTVTAELTGKGLAPKLEVDPGSADFGDVVVNESSAPMTVTIQNTGSAATPVTVTATGPFSADAAACTGSLAPGASCDIAVTFTPTIGGAAAGTLTAVGGISTTTVALAGNGLPLGIDVTTLDLGTVTIGETGSKTVTITNLSGTPVPVSVGLAAGSARAAAPTTSPFAVDTDCPASLPGGSTCTATVRFAPTEVGSASARLAVTAADAQEAIVELTGEGAAAIVPPTPSPAPTGAGAGSALPATGLAPATFGIALGGAFALAAGFALFGMLRRRAAGDGGR
ncbi:hypothetical protein ASD65_14595 [Microbacterium sp. Root61]|nr:hypothetical protein ASD65_14595 [Microbacterium sp. Root61]